MKNKRNKRNRNQKDKRNKMTVRIQSMNLINEKVNNKIKE